MKLTKGQNFINSLVLKAWEDEDFKKRLIANPIEEIENLIGKPLPKHKKVFVVDQSNPDHVYINIPAKLDLNDVELTEDQLEAVSGGNIIVDIIGWLEDFL